MAVDGSSLSLMRKYFLWDNLDIFSSTFHLTLGQLQYPAEMTQIIYYNSRDCPVDQGINPVIFFPNTLPILVVQLKKLPLSIISTRDFTASNI